MPETLLRRRRSPSKKRLTRLPHSAFQTIPALYIPWLTRRILQRLLQPLALTTGQLFQPVAVGVIQGERVTPGMVAVADLMPVLQGPAQHLSLIHI